MPSQAGNLPAKSKRSSSSQTGGLSYPDHTGEYWFHLLSRLPGSEGLSEVPAGCWLLPLPPELPLFFLSTARAHQINEARIEECGPFLILKLDINLFLLSPVS